MKNELDYMVARCDNCNTINVVSRNNIDITYYADHEPITITGVECAVCGGELKPIDYAILQDEYKNSITVGVNVERSQLDKIIEDVAALHQDVEDIAIKLEETRKRIDIVPPVEKNTD